MLLADLVKVSDQVRATRSRLAKQEALARFLRDLPPEEIDIGVAFLSGETRQARLGVAYGLLRYIEPPPAAAPALTLAGVDRALAAVASAAGSGSVQRRRDALTDLFARATAAEQSFLRRLLLSELRQGALTALMHDAIAAAAEVPVAAVRRAAMYAESTGAVARAALTGGAAALAAFDLQLFHPVAPMLAQPMETAAEAVGALGEAALDWKLDGARIQVHKGGGVIRVFTRSLNDVTEAVPEVVAAVAGLPAEELILDGEAIALDPAGRPRPFQVTMRRFGRKRDVAALSAGLPLSAFFFDLLRRDGENLVSAPAASRHEALSRAVPAHLRTPRLVTADAGQAQAFFEAALAHGHEGMMAKALAAPYEAGSRGGNWLKIKQPRTLDLVVLAAEWGSGRREGWLSNLHLGARDPATGQFVMLGKTFKGLTDEMLTWQTRELLAREIGRDGVTVHVRPELVVEIAYSDLQASPRYPGGLALRFARVKGYRPDKRAEDADTIETVRALHEASVAGEKLRTSS
jgi:DNA ligase-1